MSLTLEDIGDTGDLYIEQPNPAQAPPKRVSLQQNTEPESSKHQLVKGFPKEGENNSVSQFSNEAFKGGKSKSRRNVRKSRRVVRKSRRSVRKSKRSVRKSRRVIRKSRRVVRKSRRSVRKSVRKNRRSRRNARK